MQPGPRDTITPFVFSDPAGKRWPRLRLSLLISAIVCFHRDRSLCADALCRAATATAVFAAAIEGPAQIVAKKKPGRQVPAEKPLWEKFGLARQAAKKPVAQPPPPAHPRKKSPDNEVRLAFYTNGDPYSYASLEQHAAQLTHVCPEWMAVVDGLGDLANRRRQSTAKTRGEQRYRA